MISIPKDIYNHSLLVHLYPLVHRKDENQQEAQLLQLRFFFLRSCHTLGGPALTSEYM